MRSQTGIALKMTFTWDIAAGLPVVLDDGNQYLYGATGLTAQKQGSDWYYYLADGLGSTMAIVDESGAIQNEYTYDVYGEPTVTGSLPNEFDFAGQQTDPSTGLQYLRARYMDPETGTFMSRDPLALFPDILGHHFSYAAARPVSLLDRDGLIESPPNLRCEELPYTDFPVAGCPHTGTPPSCGVYAWSRPCDDPVGDKLESVANLGLDIAAWFAVSSTRDIVGESAHKSIASCVQKPDCRSTIDLLMDWKTVMTVDISLVLTGHPEIALIVTLAPSIWKAYKRVYDDPDLRRRLQ
jgi:RHS repeat-associated protein